MRYAGWAGAASHGAGAPDPLTLRTALVSWQFAPLVSGTLIAFAALYLLSAARVRRQHPARPWPAGPMLAFLAALVVVAVATQGSIGVYDDVLFSDHMVQHVLLIMVAPPLLVAGRPVTLLMHAWRNPLHTWVKRAVRSRAAGALTWPPGVTALYCIVVGGTHTPPFMDLVLENQGVHNAEHAVYLIAGYLFFLPVIGSEPLRRRPSIVGAYLMMLVAMMVDSFTGIVYTFQQHEAFTPYAHTGRAWGPSLVADLHLGGGVMFIGSDIIMTAIAVALAARFVRTDGRDHGEAHLVSYNAYLRALSEQKEHSSLVSTEAFPTRPRSWPR
jgi:cytochrome c oxidase assembly factor CtaG